MKKYENFKQGVLIMALGILGVFCYVMLLFIDSQKLNDIPLFVMGLFIFFALGMLVCYQVASCYSRQIDFFERAFNSGLLTESLVADKICKLSDKEIISLYGAVLNVRMENNCCQKIANITKKEYAYHNHLYLFSTELKGYLQPFVVESLRKTRAKA